MKTLEKDKYTKDLEWLFWQSESAMNIKSNFDVFARAYIYSTNDQDEIDPKAFADMLQSNTASSIFDSTEKEREIIKSYCKLSSKHKIVLEAFYEEKQYSLFITEQFGPGVGLIPFTKLGKKISKSILRDPNKSFTTEFETIKEDLQEEVKSLYNEAHSAFAKIIDKSRLS